MRPSNFSDQIMPGITTTYHKGNALCINSANRFCMIYNGPQVSDIARFPIFQLKSATVAVPSSYETIKFKSQFINWLKDQISYIVSLINSSWFCRYRINALASIVLFTSSVTANVLKSFNSKSLYRYSRLIFWVLTNSLMKNKVVTIQYF